MNYYIRHSNNLSLCINVSKIKYMILLFSFVSHKLNINRENGLRNRKDGCKNVEQVLVRNLKEKVYRFGVWARGCPVPVLKRRHGTSCYVGIQA